MKHLALEMSFSFLLGAWHYSKLLMVDTEGSGAELAGAGKPHPVLWIDFVLISLHPPLGRTVGY